MGEPIALGVEDGAPHHLSQIGAAEAFGPLGEDAKVSRVVELSEVDGEDGFPLSHIGELQRHDLIEAARIRSPRSTGSSSMMRMRRPP